MLQNCCRTGKNCAGKKMDLVAIFYFSVNETPERARMSGVLHNFQSATNLILF